MNILVSLTTFLLRTTVLITFTWYFWQDTLFGKRVTPAERLRQHQRTLEKAQRELDRERVKLENQVDSGGIFAFARTRIAWLTHMEPDVAGEEADERHQEERQEWPDGKSTHLTIRIALFDIHPHGRFSLLQRFKQRISSEHGDTSRNSRR
jgi:hypothetical protein